jgi:acetate kinase
MVCRQLGWLGLDFDATANAGKAECISTSASRVAALVLPTNEEWMLARHAAELLE